MNDRGSHAGMHARIEQVLDILAHVAFGNFDVPLPHLPENDEFEELFIGLELLIEDLRAERDQLQAEVYARTRELEEDIRQREQVEAELRASESRYRLLIETSPVPIMLSDPEGHIRMANPALVRALRLASDQTLLGTSCLDLVASEDRKLVSRCLLMAGDASRQDEAEARFRGPEGGEFIGQLHTSVLRDASDESQGVLSIIHDVTVQRQRERELLRAEQIESLGTLAGGIAHDFNNYLTAIAGCLSLAKDSILHGTESKGLLEDATEAAFRATALTRQLLTFAKGGLPVKAASDISGLVERVVEFCVRGSNVRGDVRIDEGLWPVEVDCGQLEQTLGNLVINAKQAMPHGGTVVARAGNVMAPDPRSPEAPRRYVRITVEDSGVGIPPENLHKIYDPYFSTKEGGSGLGLATAYSMIHKHGGFIDCKSTVGQGTTFEIRLPATGLAPERSAAAVPVCHPACGRILVMDDDEQVRKIAVRQLHKAGYEVVAVSSGTETLHAYRAAQAEGRPFILAILDLTVPGGDGGKETMPKLLAIDPGAKGIVVSGYSDDPVLANFRDYGFAARLAKPYRIEELFQAIAAAIRT